MRWQQEQRCDWLSVRTHRTANDGTAMMSLVTMQMLTLSFKGISECYSVIAC